MEENELDGVNEQDLMSPLDLWLFSSGLGDRRFMTSNSGMEGRLRLLLDLGKMDLETE